MSHFVLGVCIQLPVEDLDRALLEALLPHGTIEEEPYQDGHFDSASPIEFAWSKYVDATPYAWIDLEGNWHEKPEQDDPEEVAMREKRHEHLFSKIREKDVEHATTEELRAFHQDYMAAYEEGERLYPDPVTPWKKEWQAYCQSQDFLLIFCDCHA